MKISERKQNLSTILPLINETNYDTEIINSVRGLSSRYEKDVFIINYINISPTGIPYINIKELENEKLLKCLSSFSQEGVNKEKLFLRSNNYYGSNTKIKLLREMLDSILKLLDNIDDFEGRHRYIVTYVVLDYLRNIVLNLYYLHNFRDLVNDIEAISFKRKINGIYPKILETFFSYFIKGEIDYSELRLLIIDLKDDVYLQALPGGVLKDNKQFRELDNPLEILLFTLNVIEKGITYDFIVDLPSGSLSLADSMNVISTIYTDAPVSEKTYSLNFSLYRHGSENIDKLLSDKLPRRAKKVLVVDDNLFSGGTLIALRKIFEDSFSYDVIHFGVVNIYLKGIKAWTDGSYQYISSKEMNNELGMGDINVLLDNKIIRPQNVILKKYMVFPIDKYGNKVEDAYLIKASGKGQTISDSDVSIKTQKWLKSKESKEFSLIYDGIFSILNYRPISTVSFDELEKSQLTTN